MADKDENKNEGIGIVTHYFSKLGVGIIKLNKPLKVGSTILFKGKTTDFDQDVSEMELDHKKLEEGKKGQEVGIKVKKKVREGDKVFLAT